MDTKPYTILCDSVIDRIPDMASMSNNHIGLLPSRRMGKETNIV